MADPSRQRNLSGARDNPSRRRSANEDQESDNEANPMNTNNHTRRNPNDNSSSPDSQVVTSTTPEVLDTRRGIVPARESSEATPPLSNESPSLDEDLPREDSPSSLEVTSTSNFNASHPATNPPSIHQGIAGMSIDESGLDFRSSALQEATPSRRIRSVIQVSQRSRQDQNRSINLSLQNRAVGAERRNTDSEETVLSSICRRLLNNAMDNTVSTPHGLQTQPTTSSSMSLREHLTTTSRLNVSPTIHHSTRLPTLIHKETSGTNFQESAALNLPPMTTTVTTYYPAVMNPPSYASVYSSPRPKPFVPSSANRLNSSLITSPNVSTKQPTQPIPTRPPAFIPSIKSKTKSLVPTTSTRPQSPMPFSAKQPSTKEPTTTTIPMSAAISSLSLVQSSTTMTLSTSSAFSINRPVEPGSLMWHLMPKSCQSTSHPALEEAPAYASSSRIPETSSSTLSTPVLGSLLRPLAPPSGPSLTPSTPALGSLMRPLEPASKSPTRYPSVPEPIAATRFPVYNRPSVPYFNSPISSKHSASSKPSGSRTTDQNIVVPTSTDFMPSDCAQRFTQPLQINSLPLPKSKSSKIPKPLNLINVQSMSCNTSDNNAKCIKSSTQSVWEKSPTKRLANTSSQETLSGSNTDITLSPTKKLKIAFRVGEISNQSEKEGSSESEVESDVTDEEDSASEIPSPRKKM